MNGVEVTLVGNLTRDFELRYTTGGRAIASSSIAVSRRYQANGEWQEQTTFVNINVWATLGENATSSLTKGTRVIAQGRLEQRSWETEDGEKRSVMEVVVDAIGPDLRWATCDIVKNDRTQTTNEPAPQRSDGADQPAYDEEPF